MPAVTLHFPHADYENVDLPDVPQEGQTFHWDESDPLLSTEWKISAVDWHGSPAGPGRVSIRLEPANVVAMHRSAQHEAERVSASAPQ
ncbi:hypothetical protein [Streptomyces rubiginosohelvolus]|uniref:hypothetical protein n=1 Tax=Streptomyces rubiginosohelvolus TaxID=67362 RepID=UPI0035DA5D6E